MSDQKPSVGRIVHYKLAEYDAEAINSRRSDAGAFRRARSGGPIEPGEPGRTGHVEHTGNSVAAGEVYPAVVVRVFGDSPNGACNLQVLLDGNDTYWATSRAGGDGPCQWSWPPRV